MSSYAFQTAANYGNLPGTAWSPQIYSKKVQKAFRKKTVVDMITNSDYFGEIKNQGDSVRIIKEPEITVTPYARGSQLVAQDLQDEDFILTVDRANSFNFKIDDIEKMQAHVDWMDMAADRAGYKLKERYDADVLGYMAGFERTDPALTWAARTTAVGTPAWTTADSDELLAGNKLNRLSFVSGANATDSIVVGTKGSYDATPLEIINRMARKLDELNVPEEGRFIVVDPVFVEKLTDENSKLINNDYNPGADQLTNGKLIAGTLRGFSVYKSNSLPYLGTGPGTIDADGSNANYGVIVAGIKTAAATAQMLTKTETYRDTNSFADITRGLQVYGRKILRPEGLIRAIYNVNF